MFTGGNSQPFTLQVFSTGNECVRLDVLTQGTDLEIALVGPDGTLWRNDDRPASLRRRVEEDS